MATLGTQLPSKKWGHSSPLPLLAHVLWPNGGMDQDATWYKGRPLSRPHCLGWGLSSPKRGTAPNFRPMTIVAKRSPISATAEHLFRKENCRHRFGFWPTGCKTVRSMLSDRCLSVCLSVLSCLSVTLVYCGKTAGWIKMPLGTVVGLDPGHIVLDGDPAPPKRGTASQFAAHVYCGEMVDHLSYC